MIELRAADLDAYVAEIDRLGGPSADAGLAYLRQHAYVPTVQVDVTLDPFSEAYMAQQLALYTEISGRPLDQLANERTEVDVARHTLAPNAYDHHLPAVLADHMTRLAAVLRLADPVRGHWLLDMGCGWGLSSEFMAQAGLRVHAMDVNPDFVRLVAARAERLGLDIQAHQGEFESYGPPHAVDHILFYECLHHAPRPWSVLARIANALAPHDQAQILLAGEPIQATWWPHWGLRLDGESIYVMRRHGWFESGWSLPFILRCLAVAGLEPVVQALPEPVAGLIIVARRRRVLGLGWLHAVARVEGLIPEGDDAVMVAEAATLRFGPMPAAGQLRLRLRNYRTRPTRITIATDAGKAQPLELPPGTSSLVLDGIQGGTRLAFTTETWVPAEETGSADTRRIGFHLAGFEWSSSGA